MNDFKEQTGSNEPNHQPVAGFCQNCGKGLTSETIRIVGPVTYCEPCLAARLGVAAGGSYGPGGSSSASYGPAGTYPPGSSAGYTPVEMGMPPAGMPGAWPPPPAIDPGMPKPGLAALLGFIPGVGAMYNLQYAKGIVHLVVFVLLVSLADANGIFGMLVAGWVFYMVFEAYHTAKARRDGTPLPNPFGLNDIGERLGFAKAWPGTVDVAGMARDTAQTVRQGFNTAAPPPPPVAPWGAPADQYAGQYTAPYAAQQPASGYGPGYPPPPPAGYSGPYAPPSVDPLVALVVQPSRFPAGAVWLIGLGVVFLLMTSGHFDGFPVKGLIGFGLIGTGIWSFLRRMQETGTGLSDDGTAFYKVRLFRALRGGIWLVLIGVWFLLDTFRILPFHRSWPLFVILAGVMTLLERLSVSAAASTPFQPLPYDPAPSPASPQTGLSPAAAPGSALDETEKGR